MLNEKKGFYRVYMVELRELIVIHVCISVISPCKPILRYCLEIVCITALFDFVLEEGLHVY